jgi:hypothetical protein
MAFAGMHFLLLTTTHDMTDDAFIFFRYVENWVGGHGLTWNPGHEPVEGYTSFLFVVLLAIPAALGAHLPSFVHVINLLLLFALLYAMARFVAVGIGGWKPATLVAPLLAASSFQVVVFARGGMETVLFALVLVAAFHVAVFGDRRRRTLLLSGALFGLLVLVRPDGIVAYAVFVAYQVASALRAKQPAVPMRDELLRAAGVVAILAPHLIFRIAYYGELVPNTFQAKVGLSAPVITRGVKAVLVYLSTLRGGLLIGAVGLWALAPRTRAGGVLGSFLLVWLVYLATVGLSSMTWWYAMPLDVISMLWLGWSLAALRATNPERFASRRSRWIGGLALAVVSFANLSAGINRALVTPSVFAQGLYEEPSDLTQKVTNYVKVGKLMGELVEADETLAVAECGAVPYYAGIVTYDALGLNDKHIARQPVSPGTWAFGHEKGDAAYLLAQKPTYIIMKPFLTRVPDRKPVAVPSWHQMYDMPEFKRDYEFVSHRADGLFLNYYKRRD